MFWGLSYMEKEYFADRLEKFIALAPCVYFNRPPYTYDEVVQMFSKKFNEDKEYHFDTLLGQPIPANNLLYNYQVSLEKRFQHFIPFEDYFNGKKESELVGLQKIDRVPLTLIAGSKDDLCNMDSLEDLYFKDLRAHNNKKLRIIEGAGHAYFALATGNFVKEIIASIENTDGNGGVIASDMN